MDVEERTQDAFDATVIGRWSEPRDVEVSGEQIAAYAAATNDECEVHLAGERAPIAFAVVPAFTELGSVVMEPVPPHLMFKILHGEHDIRVTRPIVAGDVLTTRGRVVGIHGKSSGVVVTTQIETRDADTNDLVNEQFFAGFFRSGYWPNAVGEPFPDHDGASGCAGTEPAGRVRQCYDADQTSRYAEASGDPMPIHLDAEFAQSLGFPGVIVHGLCTMAFAARAVVQTACPSDPARLRRLAVRFGAVGFPNDILDTRIWPDRDTTSRWFFESSAGDRALIKDGLAEVAAESPLEGTRR